MMNHLSIALLYNLQHAATLGPDAPPDALAEYTTQQTVGAVSAALEAEGHEVFPRKPIYPCWIRFAASVLTFVTTWPAALTARPAVTRYQRCWKCSIFLSPDPACWAMGLH